MLICTLSRLRRWTFEPAENVLGIGERREQDDRHVGQFAVGANAAAELIAVHFRHVDVGNDHGRFLLLHRFQGEAPVAGEHDAEIAFLQLAFQLLGLGRAVFRDQDFDVIGDGFVFHGW